MKRLFCPRNHQVYPELNNSDYPYFCPNCDENFYGIEVTAKEIDEKVAHIVNSSNGTIYLNSGGDVLKQETNSECSKVVWFDLEQYEEVWGRKPEKEIDILDVRGILADGRELIWTDYRNLLERD